MKALVTGGAGFIGSHLTDTLLARGDEVMVVDRLRTSKFNLSGAISNGASLARAEVTDTVAMRAALIDFKPEVVYHLAAQIDVRWSVDDPSTDAHQNVGGTAAVLEAARHAGVKRFVLASTAGVYGDPDRLPVDEETPLAPLSPYGAGKAAAESYLALFRRLHGLSTLSLRMSNVYGPRQNPHGEAGVVAIFCAAATEGRPVTVYGDGTQTRDFVYVEDVAEAFAAAGISSEQGAINVSTGVETSLTELATALGLRTNYQPGRLGEIRRSSLDPGAAAQRLQWTARTPLAEGLRRTLASLTPA
jgi:UDP-glucose 4-epimerase